jgi:hypothetical protein
MQRLIKRKTGSFESQYYHAHFGTHPAVQTRWERCPRQVVPAPQWLSHGIEAKAGGPGGVDECSVVRVHPGLRLDGAIPTMYNAGAGLWAVWERDARQHQRRLHLGRRTLADEA